MNKLLILGAGQYGMVARDTAYACGKFECIDFLDDTKDFAVAKLDDAPRLRCDYDCAFVAIGNPTVREKYIHLLSSSGYSLPSLISPASWISPYAVIGDACIIEAHATVNAYAEIGLSTFICAAATVNHNAVVGSFCQIDCSAVIGAGACVSDMTKVPYGAIIK